MKLAAAFFLLLIGCASVNQALDSNKYYRRDMLLEVNGFQGSVLVIPRADKYTFNITALGNLDMLNFTTCHREIVKEAAGNRGIFGNKKKAVIEYVPVAGLETSDCMITVSGFAIKGAHSWAIAVLEEDRYQLPAVVKCNGSQYNSRGTTACQAKVNLIQEIIFPEPVKYVEQSCFQAKTTDNMTFTYTSSVGECLVIFKGKSGKFHKLINIAYQDTLIRED